MKKDEFFSKFKTYSHTATVSKSDFIEAVISIEDIDNVTFKLDYRMVCIDSKPLLDMIRMMFSLDADNEVLHMIILELFISNYIFDTYIEGGDIKSFRNMMLDLPVCVNTEKQYNTAYEKELIGLLNILLDIDMDVVDDMYNYLDNATSVLKQFKISNNDYLVSFLGWDRNNKTISFIIS